MTGSPPPIVSLDSMSSLESGSPPHTLRSHIVASTAFDAEQAGGARRTLIELRFCAHNLANTDFLSLSDPFAVIYAEAADGTLEELGRTETVVDDLSPRWTATLVVPVHARAPAQLVVDVYDRDSPTHALDRHDHLGRARVNVADVLAAPRRAYAALLTRSSPRRTLSLARAPRGTLRVLAEPLRPAPRPPRKIELRVRAAALRARRRRDVVQFYEISRARGPDPTDWAVVYRSEDGVHVDRYGCIRFRPARITEQLLHNIDHKRALRITFYARQTRRAHEELAYFETDANALVQKQVVKLLRDSVIDDSMSRSSGRFSSVSSARELDFDDEDGKELGHLYVEEVKEVNGDTTIVYILCDHSNGRGYTSLAADTSVPERMLRRTPAFISLH